MQRVIDQLNLLKSDFKDSMSDLVVENKIKSDIIAECEDAFQVNLLKEDIVENIECIEDFKITIVEIDQVVEILVLANDMAKK
ncbi:MAG: hypothetical protein JEZ08_24190 [Clostridiales bacterium]|nr:hypothetical protein [Clostridiales bacterium]